MLSLSADRKVNPGTLEVDGVEWYGVFIGRDPIGLGGFEVAVAVSVHSVSPAEIRQIHKLRLDGRDTNLVVAVVFGEDVTLFGPDPNLRPQMQPLSIAERKLQAALNEPDTSQAMRRFLALSDSESSGQMAGVRNRGLFASYHLRENVSKRADWSEMMDRSEKFLDSRGRQLIEDLGFAIAEQANDSFVLADSSDESRAVALLLDDSEFFDHESPRFHSSPVAWGLGIAAEKGLPWLIMLRHEQIRLYPAKDGVGVGQKGQTETYLELDLAGIAPAYYGLLSLIFSASALAQNGTAQQLLEESNRYATELGVRLRDRIYTDVVPDLARAVANQMKGAGHELDSKGLQDAYRTTLRILFRILFQAYAEDRGLLPLERNPHFYEKSLTAFAKEFLEGEASYGEGTRLWDTLQDVWIAIDEGNPEWSVPAYNGGLFGSDPERRPYGALIKSIKLPDSVVGPALSKLLVDQSGDGVLGMIDFRSLSVREFGTIYEGLLESSLSIADTDLAVDANGVWLPAQAGDTVEAKVGEPYFHNTSGERKATGSYFTPDFIVDHLIERAIDPTLDAHLRRISALLQEGKHSEAAKNFFDYRIADIAMGSAHFLVAAVDRIESKMRTFLAAPENVIPGVKNELERLAEAARVALGSDLVAIEDIDEAVLLRRQIARRCIYGIDVNPLAVELARLAIWIHTFVPGLPMSTLDHNLVCANSLTGVGQFYEVEKILASNRDPNQLSIFDSAFSTALEKSQDLLAQALDLSESSFADSKAAQDLLQKAGEYGSITKQFFDSLVRVQILGRDPREFLSAAELNEFAEQAFEEQSVQPPHAHFPQLFPETFLRENPGFDAIVGNPPWEELVFEELKFWVSRYPGLRSESITRQKEIIKLAREERPDLVLQLEREKQAAESLRRAVGARAYEGFETGNADLYKAFAWRNWGLLRNDGVAALVLPRTAFSANGLSQFRAEIFSGGSIAELVVIANSGRWAFEGVDPRYSIALCQLVKGKDLPLQLSGPISNRSEFNAATEKPATIEKQEIERWSKGYSLPLVRGNRDLAVLRLMKESPALAPSSRTDLSFWTVQGDLNQTNDSGSFWVDEPDRGDIRVLKGSSFENWDPDFGDPHGSADFDEVRAKLVNKLRRQSKLSKSAFAGLDPNEIDSQRGLPIDIARIAFRDVTNSTNTRTVIGCLIPPRTVLTNKAPYLFNRDYDPKKEAFLLAFLSSIPFDWQARRWVELSLSFFILNSFPIPSYKASPLVNRLIEVSGMLAAKDSRFEAWADAVGVPTGALHESSDRQEAIAELDALVSLSYGLELGDVEHIFQTFHRGWDYQPRLEKVLDFYRQWEDKA